MARMESRANLGFYPFPQSHLEALVKLVAPVRNHNLRMLDPFAGQGEVLHAASTAWNLTPYANELHEGRANECIKLFGIENAMHGDYADLSTTKGSYAVVWVNPPYDVDVTEKGAASRTEYKGLQDSWEWVQPGGLVMWCVYIHHVTDHALRVLSNKSTSIDIWSLPGKHLNEYDQIVVVAREGKPKNPALVFESALLQRDEPMILDETVTEAWYDLPRSVPQRQFNFTSNNVAPEYISQLLDSRGAWSDADFQTLFDAPMPKEKLRTIVPPRPGHMAVQLASDATNGAIIESALYGRVAVRGKVVPVTSVLRIQDGDGKQVKMTDIIDEGGKVKDVGKSPIYTRVTRRTPTAVVSLLDSEGNITLLEDDEKILQFIIENRKTLSRYANANLDPMYEFDYAGMKHWLDSLRLMGKYRLYNAQKQVVGAAVRGLQEIDGVTIVGQMGTGKTVLGSAASMAIMTGVSEYFKDKVPANNVMILVSPPQLIAKWIRELESVAPAGSIIEEVRRITDVKQFMDKVEKRNSTRIARIMVIPRELAKLGCRWEAAVQWKIVGKHFVEVENPDPANNARWEQRALKMACCPSCGFVVSALDKEDSTGDVLQWLNASKRTCTYCDSPLWCEVSNPVTEKMSAKKKLKAVNPRYRLDSYIKKMFGDRIYLLMWDEAHEAQHSDTGNGEAFGRFAGMAKKVIALTGTPFNGRASSLYNLLYHINPSVKRDYPRSDAPRVAKRVKGVLTPPLRDQKADQRLQEVLVSNDKLSAKSMTQWSNDMGVMECIELFDARGKEMTGRNTGTKKKKDKGYTEAPGVSPTLVSAMLRSSIFFSLDDLGKALPIYQEIAIGVKFDVKLDFDIDTFYNDIHDIDMLPPIQEQVRTNPRYSMRVFPDQDLIVRSERKEFHKPSILAQTNPPKSGFGMVVNMMENMMTAKSQGDSGRVYEQMAYDDMYGSIMRELTGYKKVMRKQGEGGFDGAMMQFGMGWVNAPWRDYELTHRLYNPGDRRKKVESPVMFIKGLDPSVVYPKEKRMIELVREELAQGRPMVIYIRQTATRDIQPRIKMLIDKHVEGANTYILPNTIDPAKRESVILGKISDGINVMICNPELVKTGLDLIYFPTLMFYEIVYNLSTMMQAAARSYRLTQTNALCKVIYMYVEGTMEAAAVHLMSRKQRGARILAGKTGLSGLEALTADEGSFEQQLARAIEEDTESFVTGDIMFGQETAETSEADRADLLYWAHGDEDMGDDRAAVIAPEPQVGFTAVVRHNRPTVTGKVKRYTGDLFSAVYTEESAVFSEVADINISVGVLPWENDDMTDYTQLTLF